jgi:hypothetical protein
MVTGGGGAQWQAAALAGRLAGAALKSATVL